MRRKKKFFVGGGEGGLYSFFGRGGESLCLLCLLCLLKLGGRGWMGGSLDGKVERGHEMCCLPGCDAVLCSAPSQDLP